ncbi:MAG: arabinose efflux permease family protein [Eubacterium sp.]|jgi:predicted MFS family arabinose efflux permease|nr:arabinose efflux permease family protein [Eubacterium sp.]
MQTNNEVKKLSGLLIFLMACSCGLIVANLYYAQPLVGPISSATGISAGASGLVVTMTQIGYVIGLLFLVPLSDLIENRKLVSAILIIAVSGLITAAFAKNGFVFMSAAVLIGLGSVAAQIIVPFAAFMAPEKQRGQIVGKVMSGLLLGIMLARPAASLLTGLWGWQTVFAVSAVINGLLAISLFFVFPKRKPEIKVGYMEIIKSLFALFRTTPVLRRRSLYQACLFGAFSLFWTTVPLWLAQHFHLSQKAIAIFALVGVAGAAAAPVAGRLADKGWTRKLTGFAFLTASFSFVLTHFFSSNTLISLILFSIAAVLLDMAVSGNLVLGQQAIYSLGNEIRGRVNGVFMAVFFIGGAIGSALGGWSFAYGQWTMTSIFGIVLPLLAFIYYLTEK